MNRKILKVWIGVVVVLCVVEVSFLLGANYIPIACQDTPSESERMEIDITDRPPATPVTRRCSLFFIPVYTKKVEYSFNPNGKTDIFHVSLWDVIFNRSIIDAKKFPGDPPCNDCI